MKPNWAETAVDGIPMPPPLLVAWVSMARLVALRNAVRARRAALEAIPRDADVDYGHEKGQIASLLWMEGQLTALLEAQS
jgi:hypothetical protein